MSALKWHRNLGDGLYELWEHESQFSPKLVGEKPVGVVSMKYIHNSSRYLTDDELNKKVEEFFGIPLPEQAFWSRPKMTDWQSVDNYPSEWGTFF